MKFLAYIFVVCFDLVMLPFRNMHPMVAMTVISVLTSLLIVIVYKYTSNQKRIHLVKSRIKGHFLAIALYKESLKVLLRSTISILTYNLGYLALNLKPMMFMMIPILIIASNMDAWYGYRPLPEQGTILLNAKLSPDFDLDTGQPILELSGGVQQDTPPVRIASESEVTWRLRGVSPGVHTLKVRLGDEVFEKELVVGAQFRRLSSVRSQWNFLDEFAYPTEATIPKGAAVEKLTLEYEPVEMNFFGWDLHWVIIYLLLSCIFAFPLFLLFGVEF